MSGKKRLVQLRDDALGRRARVVDGAVEVGEQAPARFFFRRRGPSTRLFQDPGVRPVHQIMRESIVMSDRRRDIVRIKRHGALEFFVGVPKRNARLVGMGPVEQGLPSQGCLERLDISRAARRNGLALVLVEINAEGARDLFRDVGLDLEDVFELRVISV